MSDAPYRAITNEERETLCSQGCVFLDGAAVVVAARTDLSFVRRVTFGGRVCLNAFENANKGRLPEGVYDAVLIDVVVGAHCRIARVGRIERYTIGDYTTIENVCEIVTEGESAFGAGTIAKPLNETGARTIPLVEELTAEIAYAFVLYRDRTDLVETLFALAEKSARAKKARVGTIGEGARILNAKRVKNAWIGAYAVIDGVTEIEETTIVSAADACVTIGNNAIVRHTIALYGAEIVDGAIVTHSFVGEGARIANGFSASHSLFFPNSEFEHGEAVSVMAGPFAVSHHKSTLRIAEAVSFFNAGSGANASNHAYRVGAMHQGIFERGAKVASNSYVLFPAHIGAFTIVIGAHTAHPDSRAFPFSYLVERKDGASELLPARNLFSIGMLRDGQKWNEREKRAHRPFKDVIVTDPFTPFTLSRIRCAIETLETIKRTAEGDWAVYGNVSLRVANVDGAVLRYRLALRYYVSRGLLRALLECSSADEARACLNAPSCAREMEAWVDMNGLVIPTERVTEILNGVVDGTFTTFAEIADAFREAHTHYDEDEQRALLCAYQSAFGNEETVFEFLDRYEEALEGARAIAQESAERDFSELMTVGYGVDGTEQTRMRDFTAVHGRAGERPVVNALMNKFDEEQKAIAAARARFKKR